MYKQFAGTFRVRSPEINGIAAISINPSAAGLTDARRKG